LYDLKKRCVFVSLRSTAGKLLTKGDSIVRKLTLASTLLLLMVCAVTHANQTNNQLFDCMEKATFELDSQCLSERISQHVDYVSQQQHIENHTQYLGDYAMASITFYPEKMMIEVVAHSEKEQMESLLVYNPIH
jgi:hypothetical protein